MYALATGGLWGVGLGNSAMKWNLLPHAESDYIFAIIGEELGFLGCLVVVTLYGVLAYAGFRIARRSADRFVQLASVAITVWLIGQAAMNMGYVVGPAAGHRRAAAADLRRRHLAGADPVHRRAARPVRPVRARRDRGQRAPARAAGWPGCSCRCRRPRVDPVRPRRRPEDRPSARPAAAAGRPAARPAPHRAGRPARGTGSRPPPTPAARAGSRPAPARGRRPAAPAPDAAAAPRGAPCGRRPGEPLRSASSSPAAAPAGTSSRCSPSPTRCAAAPTGGAEPRITCLGTARGMETRLVPARGYDLRLIPPVPLPRKPTVDLLRVPGRVRRAVAETRALLDELGADVVVGFGGYVALPAYLAARRAEVPVVVHEQNALPGLANRIGARLAARVAVTVPGTPLHARRARRHAAAHGDQLAGPRRAAGPRPAPRSAWTPTGPRCWSSAARRARRR